VKIARRLGVKKVGCSSSPPWGEGEVSLCQEDGKERKKKKKGEKKKPTGGREAASPAPLGGGLLMKALSSKIYGRGKF